MRFRPVVVACLAASLALPAGVGATSASAAQRAVAVNFTLDDTVISPNGDGVQDTALGTLALEDGTTYTSATWQLHVGYEQTPIGEPTPIDLDTEGAPTFVVDPANQGSDLPDGSLYGVRVTVTTQAGETTDTGSRYRMLTLDTKALKINDVSLSQRYIYPIRDKFFDRLTIELEVGGDEAADGVLEIIREGSETAAHSWDLVVYDNRRLTWNGKSDDGKMLPKGLYFAVVTTTDDAGNTARVSSLRFGLHHNELVGKTMNRTVTAAKSMFADESGRCSTIKKPGSRGWKGSVGYYSQAKCKGSESTPAHLAAARHLSRVPKAWSYGKLSVQAYAGATKSGSGHRGTLGIFDNNYEYASSATQGPSVGWQRTVDTKMPTVFRDWVVVWWFATGYGQRYDVQKFRVTLPYKVLTKKGTADGATGSRATSPFNSTSSRTSAEAGSVARTAQR